MINLLKIILICFTLNFNSYGSASIAIKSFDDLYKILKSQNKVNISKTQYLNKLKTNPELITKYSFLSKGKKISILAKLAVKHKRIKRIESLKLVALFEEIANGDELLAQCLQQKNCNPMQYAKNLTRNPKHHESKKKEGSTATKNQKHIKKIKIVSWNLQNFSEKNQVKFKRIQNYIKSLFMQGVDIVTLQEIKDYDKKQIDIRKISYGYDSFVSEYLGRNSHKERYVVLIHPNLYKKLNVNPVSVKEIKTRSFTKFQRPPYGIVFGKRFLLLNVHLIYGNSKQQRKNELKNLRKKVDELLKYYNVQNNNYIVAGDFNLNKDEIKQVFYKANITTDRLTTNKNSYDHIITNKKIKKDIVSTINRTNLSDHSPIRITVEINTKATKSKKVL